MLNILGHNIIEDKGCGFIANGEYNKFVDIMLKAQKIVDRLQCKECGHILFPAKRSKGNDSNEYTYYHCENVQCKEYHALIAKMELLIPEKVKDVPMDCAFAQNV